MLAILGWIKAPRHTGDEVRHYALMVDNYIHFFKNGYVVSATFDQTGWTWVEIEKVSTQDCTVEHMAKDFFKEMK